MSEFKKETERYFGKKVFFIVKIIIALLSFYIIMSLVFGIFPFSLMNKVVNSESIIQNYQWFYDQYNTIQSQKINYESMGNDTYEKNGMRMVLNNSIAEYNSKSKQITRNLWKAKDLPYQIELIRGGF